jgi:hypothetical protein
MKTAIDPSRADRMTGSAIARATGKSRQYISQLKKRGLSNASILAKLTAPRFTPVPTVTKTTHADGRPISLHQAQTRNVLALAQKNEMAIAAARADLVPAAKVAAYYGAKIVAARDILIGISGELADKIAIESDPAKIAVLIDDEHRRVLDILFKTGMKAGGEE